MPLDELIITANMLETEAMITAHVDRALEALEGAPLTADSRDALSRLAESISVRSS